MDIKLLTSTPGSLDMRDLIVGKILEEEKSTSRLITTSEYQWAVEELEARKKYTIKDLKEIISVYEQQMKLYKTKRKEARLLEDGMFCGIRSVLMEKCK